MAAIKQMKGGKAPGLDEIPTELLKLLEEEQIKTISEIFNHKPHIYGRKNTNRMAQI